MTAWSKLLAASSLAVGTAWQLLGSPVVPPQGSVATTAWEKLQEASKVSPGTAWDLLSNPKEATGDSPNIGIAEASAVSESHGSLTTTQYVESSVQGQSTATGNLRIGGNPNASRYLEIPDDEYTLVVLSEEAVCVIEEEEYRDVVEENYFKV